MKEVCVQNYKDFCPAPPIFKLEVTTFWGGEGGKSLEQTKKMDSSLQVDFS